MTRKDKMFDSRVPALKGFLEKISSNPFISRQWVNRIGKFLPFVILVFIILVFPIGSSLFGAPTQSGVIPIFKIIDVVQDDFVIIRTANFPANYDFTVTMGPMGTRGINGYVVDTINSGPGGTFEASFPIPVELYGSYQISIRLQTPGRYPYYSYNWFYNNTTINFSDTPATSPQNENSEAAESTEGTNGMGGEPSSAPEVTQPESTSPTPPYAYYSSIPIIKITSVTSNSSVTFQTYNYPPNQTFDVLMGPMGTRGINGFPSGQFNSGDGGSFPVTITIPQELTGSYQISIRTQTSHRYPYYSYNWFYNNTTP